MPLLAVFQAQTGNRVEPVTFLKPAGYLPHLKEIDTPVGFELNISERKQFEVNDRNHSDTDAPPPVH